MCVQDAVELGEKRLTRIRLLEAQVRQLLYNTRGLKTSSAGIVQSLEAPDDDDGVSVGGLTEDSFTTAGTPKPVSLSRRCCVVTLLM